MLNKPKNKQKTVAEKITEAILHPNESDNEDESADEATVPRVVEYDDEYELPQAGTTEFRKRNVKLLSEQNVKYRGKIASRRDYESDESEDEENYESSHSLENKTVPTLKNSSQTNSNKKIAEKEIYLKDQVIVGNEGSEFEDDEIGSEDFEDDDVIESEDDEDYDDEHSDVTTESEDEHAEVISKVNYETEIQKGICVKNQLCIWERLLDLRINLQKTLNKTNQLPLPQCLKDLENNNEYKDIKEDIFKETCLLLENLLTLKNNLSTQFSEVENAIKPYLKRPLPFKGSSHGEPLLKQVNEYLEDGINQFRPYRNNVLLKWDDRTKLLQPGLGNKKKTMNADYDIIQKIDTALINKSLLIEKSQQSKNATQNESMEKNVRNPNIYDDSDFYHQQLRELIEYKANTTSNVSEVTKQFLELQKLRRKMKKKVDTRASKGRKLRYIVHNKLINFMAPHDCSTWTVESVDELSKSLFV